MNRARYDACLDEWCDRVAWLGPVALPNLRGVDDLDTFRARVADAQRRAQRYADELADIVRDADAAVGALEEP